MVDKENNKFCEFFYKYNKIFSVHKGPQYFTAYDRHFKKFLDKNPTILEIGVDQGGSLEMWNYYFDSNCTIYGLDINDKSEILNKFKYLGMNNIHIVKGDQGDKNFWKEFLKDKTFDIVIDDGGHRMNHQIVTFDCIYDDHIQKDGVYLCEDLCTSYWPCMGGGLRNEGSFIEKTKKLIDLLNVNDINNTSMSKTYPMDDSFRKKTQSIHYYDGVVVIEKCEVPQNFAERRGPGI